MDDQNRPNPDHEPQQDDPRTWSSAEPAPEAPYVEHTRTLPPYVPAAAAPANPKPPRANKGLAASVLAGALVLGGLAGVGGAAAFKAFDGDTTSTTSSSTTGGSNPGVAISNKQPVTSGGIEKVAANVLPSVVKVNVTGQQESGSGSGIVLNKDGDILTNNHVVAAAKDGTITVNFNDGTTRKATVVGTDSVTDVAVIRVSGAKDLVPATLGESDQVAVGQTVVAIGSPYGLNATVTSGIISALNRPVSVSSAQEQAPQLPGFGQSQPNASGLDPSTTYPAIQTDAPINPGNSGGPLVDLAGRVIGMNSSIRTAGSSESGSIGLGFAIPISEVMPIVNQILDGQTPTHARLGVTVSNAADAMTQGAQLRAVESGSAGDQAGLKAGDVITKVNGQLIDGSDSLVATIRGERPDQKVEITYLRGSKEHTTTATLGSDASAKTS